MAAAPSAVERSEGMTTAPSAVASSCVSSAKGILSGEISYPRPTTRLTPGKQSTTNLTESVTMMVPRCPALGTKHK